MEIKWVYSKAIIVGSGILPLWCGVELSHYGINFEILEYAITEASVMAYRCHKEGFTYKKVSKSELHDKLMQEREMCLVISAANTYIFPSEVVAKKNLKIINWHNALLPNHKGRNAEMWSIFCGDKKTGITWHIVDSQIDNGEIIAQKEICIDDNDTALSLYKKQCNEGIELFREFLQSVLMGDCVTHETDQGKDEIHLSGDLPNQGVLDLKWDYYKMGRFLRAMDYGPLQLVGSMRVKYEDRMYSFSKYYIKPEEGANGTTIIKDDDNLVIRTDKGMIVLKKLKVEG